MVGGWQGHREEDGTTSMQLACLKRPQTPSNSPSWLGSDSIVIIFIFIIHEICFYTF